MPIVGGHWCIKCFVHFLLRCSQTMDRRTSPINVNQAIQGESKKTDTFVIHLNIKCISFFWLTLYTPCVNNYFLAKYSYLSQYCIFWLVLIPPCMFIIKTMSKGINLARIIILQKIHPWDLGRTVWLLQLSLSFLVILSVTLHSKPKEWSTYMYLTWPLLATLFALSINKKD
jgi:hypothetical protein